MALLRQVPNRSRKLQIAITEELEQRLEETKKHCAERHMELPFQESFEAWLRQLLDDAEAELNGRLAAPRRRSSSRRSQPPASPPPAAPATPPSVGNGSAIPG
ncbi:MAG: hypothetical protein AB7I59_01740 [Geminicoccaceae bacterium]